MYAALDHGLMANEQRALSEDLQHALETMFGDNNGALKRKETRGTP